MSWKVILGNEPNFTSLAMSLFETRISMGMEPYSSLLGFHDEGALDAKILFFHEESGQKYLLTTGHPIRRLSTVNPLREDHVLDALMGDIATRCSDEKYEFFIKPFIKPDELRVQYRLITTVRDYLPTREFASLREAVCEFNMEVKRGRSGYAGWGSYSFYCDLPLHECYLWARRFEETLTALFPKAVVFGNRLGICAGCEKPLRLDEHETYLFLCDGCQIKQQVEEERKKRKEKERLKLIYQEIRKQNEIKRKALGLVVKVLCEVCAKELWRSKRKIEGKHTFCDDQRCVEVYNATTRAKRQTIYTPSFLRALKESGVDHCAFPGCIDPKAPPRASNPWGLCGLHANRVSVALKNRARKRKEVLQKEGMQPLREEDLHGIDG